MINRVILVGRLTRNPELRKTPSGASVVSFTLAVDRTFKSPNQPTADFINCVAWNKTADLMAQYLHKGSLIGVEGRLQTRNYDNQQGQRVYVTEVVADSVQFLEPKGASSPQNFQPQGGYGEPAYQQNSYNNYQQTSSQGYGQPSQFDQSQGYGQPSYQKPTNPFASDEPETSSGFDDDDDGFDIASDDLPF